MVFPNAGALLASVLALEVLNRSVVGEQYHSGLEVAVYASWVALEGLHSLDAASSAAGRRCR